MRHEDLALELRAVDKVRHGSRVVEVEVCDEQQVHLCRIDVVEIWQSAHTRVSRVDPAVKHYHLPPETDDD